MDGIAQGSVQNSLTLAQSNVQITMLKKANDNSQDMAARILASAQVIPSPGSSTPGVGTMVDRRA